MADLTQAYDALKKADAAGNADDAKKLADYIRSQSAAPEEPKPETYGQSLDRTGKAFDKAAGSGLGGVGNTVAAAMDVGAHMLTGAAGDVAGAATSILTQDPKKGESVRQGIADLGAPTSKAGKAAEEYVGALSKPVSDVLQSPQEWLKSHGMPITAQTLTAAETLLGGKKGAAAIEKAGQKTGELASSTVKVAKDIPGTARKIAEKGEDAAAVRAAEDAPRNAKIEQARKLGLKIPPSEGGGKVGKALEGVSGKIQTEMAMSRDNAKIINRKAAQEIGLTDKESLTEANLEREKQKAFKVYDQVKKSGRVATDDQFRAELEKIKERTVQAEEDFPEDTNELIDKEINKFSVKSADSSSMLEKVKSLRTRASRNMQSPDAEKFELGIAQKKIATAIENQIDRHVAGSNPDLIKNFREARVKLAKIYGIEDAVSPDGNISAAVLARQLKRGVPLSGNLKEIAELYQQFPKVMRHVDKIGGHGAFSALDYLVGGVEAAANPAKAGAIVGALAGRPIARSIIRSDVYQSRAIKPHASQPSLITRAARKIGGPTVRDTAPKVRENTVSDLDQ